MAASHHSLTKMVTVFILTSLSVGVSPTHDHLHFQQQQQVRACPPAHHLLPCTCIQRGVEIYITCENSDMVKINSALERMMEMSVIIKEFHLQSNNIRSLPARFFGSLHINRLFLNNNALIRISRNAFAGLEASMEHLYIESRMLRELPFDTFDRLIKLKTLVIENTNITEIPRMHSLDKIEYVKIEGSRVANIPSSTFRLMPNMKKVHISNSRVHEINEGALEGLINLKEADFSNNKIDWIHPRAFWTLDGLEELSLAGNQITDVSMAVVATRELRSLKIFDLERNQIRYLTKGSFVEMSSVESIKLGNNLINRMEPGAIFRLPSLNILDMSGNMLSEFHADSFTESPNVEVLNIARNNLTVLADLAYIARTLPRLRILDCSQNLLTGDGPYRYDGHKKLEVLKLDFNNITTLQEGMFKNLPQLKGLSLSHNFLKSDSKGKIWDLPNLRVLDLSYNDISIIPEGFLEGLPQISSIDFSFNIVSGVHQKAFSKVNFLKYLNLSFNSLEDLPENLFIELQDINELDLSFNKFLNLNDRMLRGLSPLKVLHLGNNQIVSIESQVFKDATELRYLDLSSNFIQDLPADIFSTSLSLRYLRLHRNAIKQITDGVLSGLHLLEHLDLSHNHLQNLSYTVFRDLDVLKDLDLSVNYIQGLHTDAFQAMGQLESLNMSHNYITFLTNQHLRNAEHLRVLDLTNNSLIELNDAVTGLSSLQGLFLGHNYISSLKNISFLGLRNLDSLHFENNGLQSFETETFYNLDSLVYLNLGNNNLVELNPESFKSLRALKELRLSKNQISIIKDFAFIDLITLRSLELQDNVIMEMGDHCFENLPSIKLLNLSNNSLLHIPEEPLAALPSLDVLDLSWNYIVDVRDSSFRRLQGLTVLMLHNNGLCRLSERAFANQRTLRVLLLHTNQLARLPYAAFLPLQSLSLLDITDNPLQCDCHLAWLHHVLMNQWGARRRDRDPVGTKKTKKEKKLPENADALGNLIVRNSPVCATPEDLKSKKLAEVRKEELLCVDSARDQDQDQGQVCAPHFLDPTLFGAPHSAGIGLDPGAVNTLFHLSNLSSAFNHSSQHSFLEDENPSDESQTSLKDSNAEDSKLSPSSSPPSDSLLSSSDHVLSKPEVVTSSDYNFVTGDTPTIYAASSSHATGNRSHQDGHKNEDSSGLFGGLRLPSLPNILKTLTNLNLPKIGLNVNWGDFPSIGRQDSGGPISKLDTGVIEEPMRESHQDDTLWAIHPPKETQNFPASLQTELHPSLAGGYQQQYNHKPSVVVNVESFPVEDYRHQQKDPYRNPERKYQSKVFFPEETDSAGHDMNDRVRSVARGEVIVVPISTERWVDLSSSEMHQQGMQQHSQSIFHEGVVPNSATAFFPGPSSSDLPRPHSFFPGPATFVSSKTHSQPVTNTRTFTRPSPNFFPMQGPEPVNSDRHFTGNPSVLHWSQPEVIHPDSGVSHYQPTDIFRPIISESFHPISVVKPPRADGKIWTSPVPSVWLDPHTYAETDSSSSSSKSFFEDEPDMTSSESKTFDSSSILVSGQKSVVSENPRNDAMQMEEHTLDHSLSTQYGIEREEQQEVDIIENIRTSTPKKDLDFESQESDADVENSYHPEPSTTPFPLMEDDQEDKTPVTSEEEITLGVTESIPITTQSPVNVTADNHFIRNEAKEDLLNLLRGILSSTTSHSAVTVPENSENITSFKQEDIDPEVQEHSTSYPALSVPSQQDSSLPAPSQTPIRPKDVVPPQLGKGVTLVKEVPKEIKEAHKRTSVVATVENVGKPYMNQMPPSSPIPAETSRYRPGTVERTRQNPNKLSFQDNEKVSRENFTLHAAHPERQDGNYAVVGNGDGGGIPTIERVTTPSIHGRVQDTDIPKDIALGFLDTSYEPSLDQKGSETTNASSSNWYYSNYFREYDPYASVPVGGNLPQNSALHIDVSTAALMYSLVVTTVLQTILPRFPL